MVKPEDEQLEEHRRGWVGGVGPGQYLTLILALLGVAASWGSMSARQNATDALVTQYKSETRTSIAALKADIDTTRAEFKTDVAGRYSDLIIQFNASEQRIREDMRDLRGAIGK